METKKILRNIRRTETGQEFEKILKQIGYKEETITKAFQNKLNPTVKKAELWKKQYQIPIEAWLDIRKYLLEKELSRLKQSK